MVAADMQQDALDGVVAELSDGGRGDRRPDGRLRPRRGHRARGGGGGPFGPVHLLCNNAGVEGYLDGAIWEATDQDWSWTFDVNYWSVVHGIRAFVPGCSPTGSRRTS